MSGKLITPVRMDDIASSDVPGRPFSERTEVLVGIMRRSLEAGRVSIFIELAPDELERDYGRRKFSNRVRKAAKILGVKVITKIAKKGDKKLGEIIFVEGD